MRKPKKLLDRINITYELDSFDDCLKILNDINNKYLDKLIEFDYDFQGCTGHGEDEYCYCSSPYIEVCVYDVERKAKK